MSAGIALVLLFLASIVAVPAVLGLYSRLVKRRWGDESSERAAALDLVRRAERFWFRVSPLLLLAAVAIAILLAWEAR